jgi:hypothetical protein
MVPDDANQLGRKDVLTRKFVQLVELGFGVEFCLFAAVGPI